jgi:hypothetical protein
MVTAGDVEARLRSALKPLEVLVEDLEGCALHFCNQSLQGLHYRGQPP